MVKTKLFKMDANNHMYEDEYLSKWQDEINDFLSKNIKKRKNLIDIKYSHSGITYSALVIYWEG